MRKRSRQQYRMKERQSRNEFEICKAKRGHGADQRGIVGGLERETVPGIEVAASHSELKQMGVKAGVSDLCLPYPKGIYCGLYIEMKFGDGKHQKSQKEFLTDMAAVGHYVATCYTSEDAVEVLREYCELLSPQWMKEPNNSVWKEGTISPLKKK